MMNLLLTKFVGLPDKLVSTPLSTIKTHSNPIKQPPIVQLFQGRFRL